MELASLVQSMYDETGEFLKATIGRNDIGFKILNGPPVERAALAIVGYQPGGEVNDTSQNTTWPSRHEFIEGDYRLARNLRSFLPKSILRDSLALNVIFVRSANVRQFNNTFLVPQRRQIIEHSKSRALGLLSVVRPRKTLILGFQAAELLGGAQTPCLHGSRNRCLAKEIEYEDTNALAVLHLTGARISRADRVAIEQFVLAWLNSGTAS